MAHNPKPTRRPFSKGGWWENKATARKERQQDRKLMSQLRPGHSNARRRGERLCASDRRHLLSCAADALRWPRS